MSSVHNKTHVYWWMAILLLFATVLQCSNHGVVEFCDDRYFAADRLER